MGVLFISPFLIVLLGFVGGFLSSFFVADVPKIYWEFTVADQQMVNRYDAVRRQRLDREIDDVQMADRLELEVLPAWRAAADRFGGMKYVPESEQPLVASVNEYIRLQREALEDTVYALRVGDIEAMNKANQKREAAARLAEKIDESQR